MNSKRGSTVILEWLAIEGRGKGVGNGNKKEILKITIKRRVLHRPMMIKCYKLSILYICTQLLQVSCKIHTYVIFWSMNVSGSWAVYDVISCPTGKSSGTSTVFWGGMKMGASFTSITSTVTVAVEVDRATSKGIAFFTVT